MCNYCELHKLRQKRIPLTIDDRENYTMRKKKEKEKKKKMKKLSFSSLLTTNAKKPTATFCYCGSSQFALCTCKPAHYHKTFILTDVSKDKFKFVTCRRCIVIFVRF